MSRTGSRRSGERGFSLIEILAVVTILALSAVTVGVIAGRKTGRLQVEGLAAQTASLARSARDRAIRTRRDSVLAVDLGRRQVRGEGTAPALEIDELIDVAVTVADSEQRAQDTSLIRFFANGSSTGGTIRYGHKGIAYEVRINWFSGRVMVVRASS